MSSVKLMFIRLVWGRIKCGKKKEEVERNSERLRHMGMNRNRGWERLTEQHLPELTGQG
jgi:hypothetical protein